MKFTDLPTILVVCLFCFWSGVTKTEEDYEAVLDVSLMVLKEEIKNCEADLPRNMKCKISTTVMEVPVEGETK